MALGLGYNKDRKLDNGYLRRCLYGNCRQIVG